jgi:hypothetical protein
MKRGTYQLYDLVEEARSLIPADDKKPFERPQFQFSSMSSESLPDTQVATEYMGKTTLEMIAEYLKEYKYNVLHSEVVLNPRLQVRFENMWDQPSHREAQRLEKFPNSGSCNSRHATRLHCQYCGTRVRKAWRRDGRREIKSKSPMWVHV